MSSSAIVLLKRVGNRQSEFLFLYESNPIIVSFNVFEQFFCETVSSFFNQRGSVTDAVKQWWLPRASLNEELIETFVELTLQWWIAWQFDLHFAVFVMQIANETILFTGR